jgi:hypothetical protein
MTYEQGLEYEMTCFIKEYNKIKHKYSEVFIRSYSNIKGTFMEEYFNENKNCICIITSEYFCKEYSHIHYYDNYSGSETFNLLLEKYNLEGEWYNSCVFVLYKKIDF